MNDEIERRLRRLSPTGAPARASPSDPRRRGRRVRAIRLRHLPVARFRPALAASFAVIFGLALNYWANVNHRSSSRDDTRSAGRLQASGGDRRRRRVRDRSRDRAVGL